MILSVWATSITYKALSRVCLFSILPPRNVTNVETYRGAGDGFAVYVDGVTICDIVHVIKRLLFGKVF
jgi:hypothetical protein